jgi:hypothetical protein
MSIDRLTALDRLIADVRHDHRWDTGRDHCVATPR